MTVGGLGFDPRNLSPVVLLRDPEELNFLPIWIGVFEAASIATVLQGILPPRPMTHDLFKETVEKLKILRNNAKSFIRETNKSSSSAIYWPDSASSPKGAFRAAKENMQKERHFRNPYL